MAHSSSFSYEYYVCAAVLIIGTLYVERIIPLCGKQDLYRKDTTVS